MRGEVALFDARLVDGLVDQVGGDDLPSYNARDLEVTHA